MSYPLIILGAGASFDCIDQNDSRADERMRPPLTNEIFHRRFEKIIKNYEHLDALPATIQRDIQNGDSLEQSVSRITKHLTKSPELKTQLTAFEFYLQSLFKEISSKFGGQSTNNYSALVQEINMNFRKALIVNFNYDTLFEQALSSKINRNHLDSYIIGPIKVIKVHGSCEWVYGINDFTMQLAEHGKTYSFIMNDLNYVLSGIDKRNFYRKIEYSERHPTTGRTFHYYPAIAIPEPGKNSFVCPQAHIQMLKEELTKIDKILVIGWQAGDDYFLKVISECLGSRRIPLSLVSPGEKALQNMANRFREFNIDVDQASQVGAFSKFVGSDACRTFFGTA